MDEAMRSERLRAMGVRRWLQRVPTAPTDDAVADADAAAPTESVPAATTEALRENTTAMTQGVREDTFGYDRAPDDESESPSADVPGDDFGPMYDSDEPVRMLDAEAPSPADVVPVPAPDSAADARIAVELAPSMDALRQQVSGCVQCELHRTRTQTVFGVGNESARLLVIGEAPGADEDARGEPFVGRAGQLLNAMLQAIGLQRDAVYIANILKCRPPRNRDPLADEVDNCEPYLQQQIAFIEPELILAVGRVAAQNLLGVTTPIGKLRGKLHRYGTRGTPVIVTYHPAYLLRSPLEKRRAWEDLKQVAVRLGERS